MMARVGGFVAGCVTSAAFWLGVAGAFAAEHLDDRLAWGVLGFCIGAAAVDLGGRYAHHRRMRRLRERIGRRA